MILISAALIVCLAVCFLSAVLLSKLHPRGELQPIAPGDFRMVTRYGPMERLLEEADCRFLASHPAVGRKVAAKMRTHRREIFRGYLNCLSKDYARICASIRLIMLQSGIDRPDLAKALLRNRLIFTAALAGVEFRLAMHACGWGTVEVRQLVASLEGMRQQLDLLAAAGPGLQPASVAA
ncbi:MAG: hypothetical protein M3Z23_11375 [Acidobacteriota bacterium]|nr:hypothetical protein [Acidobacteriota bacterium]